MNFYTVNRTLILAAGAFSLLVSCGGGEEKKTLSDNTRNNWKTENTVVYHVLGDPDNLHPTNGTTSERSEILLYTQIHLIQTNYPNPDVPCPQLAVKAPELSPDGLNYTYELRDDMKFDDGSVITAEDVIFSFKAVKCPLVNNPQFKPYCESLNDIAVDPSNPKKITLVMKEKYINNLWFVTDVNIIQRKFFDPENVLANYSFAQFNDPKFKSDDKLNNWAENFNDSKYGQDLKLIKGAGPYEVSGWDAGQTLTLSKKKNHWTEGKTGLYEVAYPEKNYFQNFKRSERNKSGIQKTEFRCDHSHGSENTNGTSGRR